jgi:hypothetical protein
MTKKPRTIGATGKATRARKAAQGATRAPKGGPDGCHRGHGSRRDVGAAFAHRQQTGETDQNAPAGERRNDRGDRHRLRMAAAHGPRRDRRGPQEAGVRLKPLGHPSV